MAALCSWKQNSLSAGVAGRNVTGVMPRPVRGVRPGHRRGRVLRRGASPGESCLALRRTADPLHDPVGLVLADLVELVVHIPPLVRVKHRAPGPFQVASELLVIFSVLVFDPPQDAAGLLSAAVVIHNRV